MEDRLSENAIRLGLDTAIVGRSVHFVPTVGSTNSLAVAMVRSGEAPDGTVVVADYQWAGKGRLGRAWLSGPGEGILLSVIFRPRGMAPDRASSFTMLCSLACTDAVESELGLQVGLKWPNDLILAGRKLGGVLTELETAGEALDFVVVGLGINANMDPTRYPQISATATSLRAATGGVVRRSRLLRAIMRRIDDRYAALRAGRNPHRDWETKLVNLGEPMRVNTLEGEIAGVAEGVDPTGALLLRRADGSLTRVLEGDVALTGPGGTPGEDERGA